MLAHKLTDRRKPAYPFYVQPKLNGVRALWNGETLYSRDLKIFSPINLRHIYHQLTSLPPLDGELYCHGLSLQQINARVAVNRTTPHAESLSISYCVFDAVVDEPFEKRQDIVYEVTRGLMSVVAVETILVNSPTSEEAAYKLFKKQNYEGMMYRDAKASYGFVENCGNKENRWTTLLKRKDWLDVDLPVVDVAEGTGQFQGKCGSLVLEIDGKKFNVGSGMTHSQRQAYWDSPPVGRVAKISYEMLSDGGVPLKPVLVEIK